MGFRTSQNSGSSSNVPIRCFIFGVPFIGAEFLPTMDTGEISVTIETDKGSVIGHTDEVTSQVEEELRQIPEVETIFSTIGSSGNMMDDSGQPDRTTIYTKLVPLDQRDRSVEEVTEEIRNKVNYIPGAKINATVFDVFSFGGTSDL